MKQEANPFLQQGALPVNRRCVVLDRISLRKGKTEINNNTSKYTNNIVCKYYIRVTGTGIFFHRQYILHLIIIYQLFPRLLNQNVLTGDAP